MFRTIQILRNQDFDPFGLCAEPSLANGDDDPEVVDKMIMQISGKVVSNLMSVVEFHSVTDEIQQIFTSKFSFLKGFLMSCKTT